MPSRLTWGVSNRPNQGSFKPAATLDDPATWTAEEHLYHLFLFLAAKGLDQTIQSCVNLNFSVGPEKKAPSC